MAPQDAEMPSQHDLGEDIRKITQHIGNLRRDLDKLTGSISRAGSHQAEHMQDKAQEALGALEDAVKRDPVTSLGVALGAGFLLGVLLRR